MLESRHEDALVKHVKTVETVEIVEIVQTVETDKTDETVETVESEDLKQARKPRSYASPKLRLTDSLTDLLTGVKCRATSVAKKG